MGTITESAGFKGTETRVLVDSVVGFQALVDTGCISLLKVEKIIPVIINRHTSSGLSPGEFLRAGSRVSTATTWIVIK